MGCQQISRSSKNKIICNVWAGRNWSHWLSEGNGTDLVNARWTGDTVLKVRCHLDSNPAMGPGSSLLPEPWRFPDFFSNLDCWVSVHCFSTAARAPQWELLTKNLWLLLGQLCPKWHRSQSWFCGLSWVNLKTWKCTFDHQVPVYLPGCPVCSKVPFSGAVQYHFNHI